MKHHVPIDAPGRAPPVASTANMYTPASVRLLSFWLTATCSSAVKARTIRASNARECIRLYIVVVEARGARDPASTQRLWARDVSSQAFPVFNVSLPRTINARNKSRNGEGLGPRLTSLVSLLRAIIPRMTFEPSLRFLCRIKGHTW